MLINYQKIKLRANCFSSRFCAIGSQHARIKDLLSARETAKEWVMREPFIPED
jgi:hypothetical protein